MVRIVTDSLSDIPKEMNADGHICVIPLTVTIEDVSYLDGVGFLRTRNSSRCSNRQRAFPKRRTRPRRLS